METTREPSVSTASLDPTKIASRIDRALSVPEQWSKRACEQVRFAAALAIHHDNDYWAELIIDALDELDTGDSPADPEAIVEDLETALEPIGEVARTYTVHYVGHAHIDMNWLWDYPETVHTTYRTFSTMFDIMDEYPEFRFTQSQASTYAMMADHAPELVEEIRNRIDDGQWEVAANTWVQGDKNLASGESQVRQLLYANEFIDLELDTELTSVDFEPDTFGHPQTVPKILQDAGIDYYYLGRSGGDRQPDTEHGLYGAVPQLFWWESEDGSRVLTFNGAELWYNGHVDPASVTTVLDFEAKTNLREFLDLYGVGNHGGGPTRDDVATIQRMDDWPIFPQTTSSTLKEYFKAVESAGTDSLPVVSDELNFTFRGCYSSQSDAKQYNKKLEALLPAVESLAVIASQESDFKYPDEKLEAAWRSILFNQFHDILPGAGIPETYDHALGRYQEAEAAATMIRDRSLTALTDSGLYHEDADAEAYAEDGVPLLVFNPTGRPCTSHIRTIVYDYPDNWKLDDLVAVDADGSELPVQVLETIEDVNEKKMTGEYAQNRLPEPSRLMHDSNFGPHFARIALTVPDLPAYGYKLLYLQEGDHGHEDDDGVSISRGKDAVSLENHRYRLGADARSGAITTLYDKVQDRELVPDGDLFGLLSVEHEVPHDMSAWLRDQVMSEDILDEGWKLEVVDTGPAVAAVRWERDYEDSILRVELRLPRGTPEIELLLDIDWREIGDENRGVPVLRTHFPIAAANPTFRYDVPYGFEIRPADGKDVPANKWADVTDATTGTGVTVTNDTTHGHSARGNTLSLTLLRSTYSPDPNPEIGSHHITCTLRPHGADWDIATAARHGRAATVDPVTEQLMPNVQNERFPKQRSFLSVDTDQVAITSVKQANDDTDVIVRLHERAGEPCQATLSVGWSFTGATETNLLEQAKPKQDLVIDNDEITVELSPHEIQTIRLTSM